MLDDRTAEPGDLQLHSIAHGVICWSIWRMILALNGARLRVIQDAAA